MSCVVLSCNCTTESGGAGAGIQLVTTCWNGNYNPAPGETLPFVKDIPVSTKAAWKDIRHSNIEYTQVVTKHKGLYIIVATLETKIPTGKFPSFFLHWLLWRVKGFSCCILYLYDKHLFKNTKLSTGYFWVYLTLNHNKHPGIQSDWEYFCQHSQSPVILHIQLLISTVWFCWCLKVSLHLYWPRAHSSTECSREDQPKLNICVPRFAGVLWSAFKHQAKQRPFYEQLFIWSFTNNAFSHASHLSLNALFLEYLCRDPSSMMNLIFSKKEAVGAGGCLCRRMLIGLGTV